MDNHNKTVLVIGGAAGIGKEIVVDFATKGFHVAVADIDEKRMDDLIGELDVPGKVSAFPVDVSSWESVSTMVQKVKREFTKLDIMVFSAGITRNLKFTDISWELWQKTMAINLHGLFYSIKAVSEIMVAQESGNIIIIGSGSAITGSGGGAQYYASKGGAFGLMRSLVTELGAHGINVNVVAPRVIESEMLDILYPTEETRQKLCNKIPIGRFGKPSDISGLVDYLTDEESTYVHGQIILLDGGRTYTGRD